MSRFGFSQIIYLLPIGYISSCLNNSTPLTKFNWSSNDGHKRNTETMTRMPVKSKFPIWNVSASSLPSWLYGMHWDAPQPKSKQQWSGQTTTWSCNWNCQSKRMKFKIFHPILTSSSGVAINFTRTGGVALVPKTCLRSAATAWSNSAKALGSSRRCSRWVKRVRRYCWKQIAIV